MNTEQDESAICLYIDELKSDDQSLKINAVDKISIICSHLSKERIYDEFFPYLQYIIEECDNEDEFLIKLSQNLTIYLQNISSDQKIYQSAMKVFEQLVAMEDIRVRESALEGLKFLSRFLISDISDLIIKLGTSEITYAKVFCCKLIINILETDSIDGETLSNCSKIIILLVEDKNLQVKRSALIAVEFLWNFQSVKNIEMNDEFYIKSEKFINRLGEMIKNIDNSGVIFELLKKSFLTKYFEYLNETQKNEIKICLLTKLIQSLDNNFNKKLQKINIQFVDNEVNGVKDKEWKLKYMICNCFELMIELNYSNNLEQIVDFLKNTIQQFDLCETDSLKKGSTPTSSKILQKKYLNENSSCEEEVFKLISELVYNLFRKYISIEMQEIRSVYFSNIISFCRRIQNNKYQLIFLNRVIDLVNEFILYEKSFYVKMKLSCFLEIVLEISQNNSELTKTWNQFSNIRLKKNLAQLQQEFMNEKNVDENDSENQKENELNRVNNFVILNTEILKVEFNPKNLINYSHSIFNILYIDRNPEIFKYKFIYLKKIIEMGSSSNEIRNIFFDLISSINLFYQDKNIKLKEIALQLILYIIDEVHFNEEKYSKSPLLPIQIPKIKKSENDLISLSQRTSKRKISEENQNTNKEGDEEKIIELNIRYALSTFYKGYLATIDNKSFGDEIFSSKLQNYKEINSEKEKVQENEHNKMKLDFLEIMKKKEENKFVLNDKEANEIKKIILNFCDDNVISVRNKIIEIICGLVNKLNKQDFDKIIDEVMKKWISHKSYMFRQSAIHVFAILSLIKNYNNLNLYFSLVVKNGLKEKVSNVKLCLLRMIGLVNQIHPNLKQRNQQLRILLGFYEGDINKNVSFIAKMLQEGFE